MSDSPMDVVRKKKDSSISVGMHMLAEQQGEAFVSAGNSGAVVAAAVVIVVPVVVVRHVFVRVGRTCKNTRDSQDGTDK